MFDFLLTEQEKAIRNEVRAFVANKVPAELVRDMDQDKVKYPHSYIDLLAEAKLIGLRFPKKYGGRGLSWVAEMAAIEEIGVLGASLGCLFSLPSIVGEAIDRFGSEDQKERYLAPMCAGKLTCAEALTEPRGGSDFFGAATIARKDGKHYVLTGQKRFVVGSEGADFFLVYAKTDPKAEPHKSIGVFLVDRCPELEVKHVYGLMGTRGGGTGRLLFNDVKVPAENLVGPENAGGMIFNRMMIPERMTSAAGALGMARAALEVATRYSMKRKAFGRVIREFEAVSFAIADSISKLDAATALVYAAARSVDLNLESRRCVSEAKKIATTFGWEIINHAMQVMGGIGYTDVFPIERYLRDARLSMIWTGTNEIMNLLIQHEFYKEMKQGVIERNLEADAINPQDEEKVYE